MTNMNFDFRKFLCFKNLTIKMTNINFDMRKLSPVSKTLLWSMNFDMRKFFLFQQFDHEDSFGMNEMKEFFPFQ